MTTVEEIAQGMLTLRAEFEAQEVLQQQQQQQQQQQLTQQVERTVAVEQEVLRLQAKLREREAHGKGRDLFIAKKGFSALPQFDGKAEKYDDWRFKVVTFLEMEDHFSELLTFVEKLPKMPTEEDCDEWEDENEDRNFKLMNEQLYNFLCLNLKDEALTMVKNMKLKPLVSGVASWWKFQHDCQALTGQRIQALANAIYKPSRAKKYADVAVAIERWERDISRFEAATGKIAEETKTFSLRQLVPEELDQLITANSNTLKNYEQVKAYVEEQVSLRRDKKSNGPAPMDLDILAEKLLKVTEGAEEWSNQWNEEVVPETPADTCGVHHVGANSEPQGNHGKLSEQLEAIMSFVMKGKGKGKGKGGKGKAGKDTLCWHCLKHGHMAKDCWQKDAEMEEYRKGKGKGKGYGKGPYGGYGKGAWESHGAKSHGKGHGKKGLYWFDQPSESSNYYDQAWAFAVSVKPKPKTNAWKPSGPPGLAPPIVTSNTRAAFADEETWPEVGSNGVTPLVMTGKAPKANFCSKSQAEKKEAKKKAKEENELMDSLIKANMMRPPVTAPEHTPAPTATPTTGTSEPAMCLTAVSSKEESVNMVAGNWRREDQGWVRVRSVMDSGCGVSVAPPGMCPAYPIAESEGSRRGQEFMSASEDTMPNLGEQKLEVVLDSGKSTSIKYQIADVSRALNAVTEICDAGHPDHGNHVIFGRRGGMIVNLETGKRTLFQREGNIYCLDYWVKPFTRQER